MLQAERFISALKKQTYHSNSLLYLIFILLVLHRNSHFVSFVLFLSWFQGKHAFSVTVVGMMIMTVLMIRLAHCQANDEIEVGGWGGGWG